MKVIHRPFFSCLEAARRRFMRVSREMKSAGQGCTGGLPLPRQCLSGEVEKKSRRCRRSAGALAVCSAWLRVQRKKERMVVSRPPARAVVICRVLPT